MSLGTVDSRVQDSPLTGHLTRGRMEQGWSGVSADENRQIREDLQLKFDEKAGRTTDS